uniref:Uncharacterized protein n=1 Tax=Cacopsylla melanoneura TaxID=428564 RepID=A0A8D8YRZ2_9HEMI
MYIGKVAREMNVGKKGQDRRLQWFGHVERNAMYVGKVVREMNVGKEDRKGGRKTWIDNIHENRREKELLGSRNGSTKKTFINAWVINDLNFKPIKVSSEYLGPFR